MRARLSKIDSLWRVLLFLAVIVGLAVPVGLVSPRTAEASFAAFDNPAYDYTNITNVASGTYYSAAGFNPDGTRIVAQKRWTDGSITRREIVLINPDGSGETVITAGDSGTGDIYGYLNPFWSDDGSAVGFVEVHNTSSNKVVRYDISSSTSTYIYEPVDTDVANPDFMGGSKTSIVFWAYGAGGSVADLWTWDGATLTNITNTADYKEYEPVSNADGTKIVYWSGETTAEPVNTTHTLTYSSGTWTKDVGFTPIADSYWAYWTTPSATQIALTVMSSKDIHIYSSGGISVADLSGPGYSGGSGQWNFFGSMPQSINYEFAITSNAAMTTGRDIVIVSPRDLYVDDAGSDSNPGTEASPFATIQHAVDVAAPGCAIHVAAGTYDTATTIVLNKALTISGPTSGTATVRGTATDMFKVFVIAACDVTIQNLEITLATTPAYPLLVGDELNSSLISIPSGVGMTGIAITGNRIYVPAQTPPMTGWTARAITVGSGTVSGISITGNTIYNTRNGVVIHYSNTATISNNTIYNTKGGIMNYTSTQADANNRTMSNNLWTTAHNEWDIVWNSGGGPYAPDYNQSVLVLSGANNDAYVVSLMTTGVLDLLTGNRSHVFVNTTGTTTKKAANGNQNLPYATIALGIEAVVPGGTVYVADGTYTGAILAKDVTLIGAAGGGSVIATGVQYADGVSLYTGFRLDATADGAEIRNFTVNCNSAASYYFGVFSRGADGVVVDSLTVNDAVQGITNWGGSNWEIANNVLTDTVAVSGGGTGIFLGARPVVSPTDLRTCSGNYVHDNTISSTATAPDYTCPGIVLALDLRSTSGIPNGGEKLSLNRIEDNDYTGTGGLYEVGIEIGVIGLGADPAKIAATLGMIDDNTVSGNTVDGADYGMYFYTVTDLQVVDNDVVNCVTAGIALYDGVSGAQFSGNNIYDNAYGLYNETGVLVDAEDNWWGDATGPAPTGAGNAVSGDVDYEPWVGETPPAAPDLVSPANGAWVPGTSIEFSWDAVDGATKYFLEVNSSSIWAPSGRLFFGWVGNNLSQTVTGFPNNGTKYYWRVYAGNDSGYSDVVAVTAKSRNFTNKIGAPDLVSPANGASVPGTSIEFSWSAVAGANRYFLEVNSSSTWAVSGRLFFGWVGNNLSQTVTGFPNNGTKYYWRVYAGDDSGYSDVVAVTAKSRSFTNKIGAPDLVSPANGAWVPGTSIEFSWSAVAGANRYFLEVTSSSTWAVSGRLFFGWVGNNLSQTVSGFPNNGTKYYWRVYAGDDSGYSDVVAVTAKSRSFTNKIGAPDLVSPANGAWVPGTSIELSWSALDGANRYFLEVNSSSTWAPSGRLFFGWVGNNLSQTVSGFPNNGTKYYWRVYAGDDSGYSDVNAVTAKSRSFTNAA